MKHSVSPPQFLGLPPKFTVPSKVFIPELVHILSCYTNKSQLVLFGFYLTVQHKAVHHCEAVKQNRCMGYSLSTNKKPSVAFISLLFSDSPKNKSSATNLKIKAAVL
ncbi:hypothetical protein CRENBAI_022156 [Crenichthys baileyi]|uniref:Uncharacterized protein n=1 Tax=Crenichthys baileyi TaxID=28760 RepID=A0AAV9RPV7_9TELE